MSFDKKSRKEMGEKSRDILENTNVDNVAGLIQAFEYFTESSEKLRESYDELQVKISALDLELEKKNLQLYDNLREKDSIKNYLENILESMDHGVIVVDLDGKIMLVNQAALGLVGYKENELLGTHYSDVIGKVVQVENTPIYSLHQGKEKKNAEKEISAKDGTLIPVEFSTTMVRGENNVPLGVLEIFRDLREMKMLREQVQQTKTLAALGEMASNVAHEIRNPLGGIGGYAALLQRDLDVEDPRRKLVSKIIDGVERLNRIATNLLVYTRPMLPKKRKVDFIYFIEEVSTLVQVELEQDESTIVIESKFNKIKELIAELDPELFQQVLLNLLKNAVQASDEGGKVVIELKNIKKKKQVEVSVKDTGVGIPENYLSKLYMPFFTTKADGTGLGLSIVKKIMDSHSGEIDVVSKEGKGTTFYIRFPY